MSNVQTQLNLLNELTSLDNAIENLNQKLRKREKRNNDSICLENSIYITIPKKLQDDHEIEYAVSNLIDIYSDALQELRVRLKKEYLAAVIENSTL